MSKSPFYKTGISKSPLHQYHGEAVDTHPSPYTKRVGQERLTGEAAATALTESDVESPAKMKGSPLHQKNKRKKGEAYITGSSIDETDFEQLNTGFNVQDINNIQEDAKGQFITSIIGKQGAYVDETKQDTIRPTKGMYFKMGWDDNSTSRFEKKVKDKPKEAPTKDWTKYY